LCLAKLEQSIEDVVLVRLSLLISAVFPLGIYACQRMRLYDTIRYDTRSNFNVPSKADISQLNLPHETKVKNEKRLQIKKSDMLRSIGKQSRNP